MRKRAIEKDDTRVLSVCGDFKITQVSDIHQQLLVRTGKYSGITLDLSGVTEFDTAAVQLIESVRSYAQTLGVELDVSPVTDALIAAGDRIGVSMNPSVDVIGGNDG